MNAPLAVEYRNQLGLMLRELWSPAMYGGVLGRRPENKNPFIGIAVSGGGSRAANFSLAVLKALEEMGIMKHVSVISSVSGGSVGAAYYTLAEEIENRDVFWSETKSKFQISFRSIWLRRLLSPTNFFTTIFTDRDRSDVMASVFNDYLFKRKTFRALEQAGAVNLRINATAINSLDERAFGRPACLTKNQAVPASTRWQSFTFLHDTFRYCLASDLLDYPIANAVMASAAFPGVFNSVTLAKFPLGTEETPESYIHLMDGGASDNLGVDGLVDSRTQTFTSACLYILIDSFVEGDAWGDLSKRSDLRGALGRFVDPNFVDAFDSLLWRRRFDTLSELGLRKSFRTQSGWSFGRYKPIPKQPSHVSDCAVWHIALSELRSIPYVISQQKSASDKDDSRHETLTLDEAMIDHYRLWSVTNRISTDFDLVGPASCSPAQLSDALWLAGEASVWDDFPTRQAVCKMLRNFGLPLGRQCDSIHNRHYTSSSFIAAPSVKTNRSEVPQGECMQAHD